MADRQDRFLSAAWLERKLRTVLGVTGSDVLQNISDARGLIVLESDRPEYSQPAGERLCAGSHFLAAGAAGDFGNEGLENPPNSGILVIVEGVMFLGGAAATAQMRIATSAGIASFTSFGERVFRDTRDAFTPAGLQRFPTALLRQLAAPGVFGLQMYQTFTNPAAGAVDLLTRPFPVVLAPGSAILMQSNDDAATFVVSWKWRERPLESGALA